MRTIDAVLFDKTGTLTKGAHIVTASTATDDVNHDEVRAVAASASARQSARS